MLTEVLEFLSWSTDVNCLKKLLAKPELVDHCAGSISFMISTLLTSVSDSQKWIKVCSELGKDAKLLMTHLIILVVCFAGKNVGGEISAASSCVGSSCEESFEGCSDSCYWKLCQYAGQRIQNQLGDLHALQRWTVNCSTIRFESAQYLGESFEDEEAMVVSREYNIPENEMDENQTLAFLEEQVANARLGLLGTIEATSSRNRRLLAKRFISALANDGRFDSKRFARFGEYLRVSNHETNKNEAASQEYELIDVAWAKQFDETIARSQEMIQVHEDMEKL